MCMHCADYIQMFFCFFFQYLNRRLLANVRLVIVRCDDIGDFVDNFCLNVVFFLSIIATGGIEYNIIFYMENSNKFWC